MALTEEMQRTIIWEKIWLTSKLAILIRGPRFHHYVWFWKLKVGLVWCRDLQRERERDKELREKDKELIIAKSPIVYASRLGKTMPNVILDLQIDS